MQPAERTELRDRLTFAPWAAGVVSRWRLVLAVTAVALALGLATTVLLPPVYRSHASFVANTSNGSKLQGNGGANSAIGDLVSQFGGSMGGDPSESPNFYLQLLASRELLTRLLSSRFPDPRTANPRDTASLLAIMRPKPSDSARRMEVGVKQMLKSVQGEMDPKTNLVWFSVDAQWPELSSGVANRLIDLVSGFNRETRMSRAKSKRIFLQNRLDSAQAGLRSIEGQQRFFYEQNRGTLTAPGLKLEVERLRREVDLASDLYLNLQRQLEIARINEINDAAIITVIDKAVPPRKARWPRYGAVIITSAALGMLLGLMVAGSMAVMEDWRTRNSEDWQKIRRSVREARADVGTALGRKPVAPDGPQPASQDVKGESTTVAHSARPIA